ncbi:MAG TPA: ATP12 family protein [Xanthobacteraceae bacterium]|nr:ATP12 family protein [Xanthobacteraceae bacterium]
MRELFEDVFSNEPLDPVESARRNMRPNLRKRFYERAAIGENAPYPVLLDGRVVKTPAGSTLAAPSAALAEAIAAEWNAQGERIDPATMPLTRLANTIIDGVASNSGPVAEEVAKYLESDLVCYRADAPEGLIAAQAQHWDPVLAWTRDAHGARFVLSEGVMFVAQPESAVAGVRAAIPSNPWRLGAVHLITTLTGSALIALAVAAGELSVEDAWAAAHVDEDWNMKLWGRDEIALARRAARFADMQAAGTVLSLTE